VVVLRRLRPKPSYPLTDGQLLQLKALEGRTPDTGAIPPAPEADWATSVRGRHHAAVQGAVSVRLGPDVLAWLRRKGPDCRAEINRILREKMEAEMNR
jgi:uncharacterized protein (DUF4415 family)